MALLSPCLARLSRRGASGVSRFAISWSAVNVIAPTAPPTRAAEILFAIPLVYGAMRRRSVWKRSIRLLRDPVDHHHRTAPCVVSDGEAAETIARIGRLENRDLADALGVPNVADLIPAVGGARRLG